MIHEYGHQHGIPHPFDDQVGQGTFGGIMDYGDSRLILPDPNAGRQAFSQTTDANAFCADMTDLLQRSNENNCWVVDDDQLFNSKCEDGILDPWEACDGGPCCENCKFKPGAT